MSCTCIITVVRLHYNVTTNGDDRAEPDFIFFAIRSTKLISLFSLNGSCNHYLSVIVTVIIKYKIYHEQNCRKTSSFFKNV